MSSRGKSYRRDADDRPRIIGWQNHISCQKRHVRQPLLKHLRTTRTHHLTNPPLLRRLQKNGTQRSQSIKIRKPTSRLRNHQQQHRTLQEHLRTPRQRLILTVLQLYIRNWINTILRTWRIWESIRINLNKIEYTWIRPKNKEIGWFAWDFSAFGPFSPCFLRYLIGLYSLPASNLFLIWRYNIIIGLSAMRLGLPLVTPLP